MPAVDRLHLVTPSPSRDHQLAVKFLQMALQAYLESPRIGEVLAAPFDVELEAESVTQPDLLVLPNAECRRLADPAAKDRPGVATSVLAWQPPGATHSFQLDLENFFDRIDGSP